MKIETRIKTGKLKGWTIRKSKHGWYDLYSSSGVSQTKGKHTLNEIKKIIANLKNGNNCSCSFVMIMRDVNTDKPFCAECGKEVNV